jgi:hypothetical protein
MDERRREARVSIALPVKVLGHGADGSTWSEMTRAEDVSSGGAAFQLKRAVATGEVLQLALPMPKALRQHDLMDASYSVHAIVRDVGPPGGGGSRVGVMFLGKRPPAGFEKGVRMLLPSDRIQTRQHPRYELKLNVRLRRMETSVGPSEEWTVTEDLGPGGALVPTGLPIMKGETVSIETEDGAFKTRASVQNLTIGRDNVPRLSLSFLDPGADAAASEVLRQNGFVIPGNAKPHAATPRAPVESSPVRFDRRGAFPQCASGQHDSCPGLGSESGPRIHRLCRCSCHDLAWG